MTFKWPSWVHPLPFPFPELHKKFGAHPAAYKLNFLKHTNFFPSWWWISEELWLFFSRSPLFGPPCILSFCRWQLIESKERIPGEQSCIIETSQFMWVYNVHCTCSFMAFLGSLVAIPCLSLHELHNWNTLYPQTFKFYFEHTVMASKRTAQLSPGIILMSGVVHDTGILQS